MIVRFMDIMQKKMKEVVIGQAGVFEECESGSEVEVVQWEFD